MSIAQPTPRHEVLLVDDDPGDRVLIAEAWRTHRLPARLHTALDGTDALAFLHRQPPHEYAPRPDLILLDLNMPGLDGRAVLAAIKTDPQLCAIPVVVLTTSADPGDVTASYTAHANAYITKPADLTGLSRVVRGIYRFFGETARIPAPSPAAEHGGDDDMPPRPDDPGDAPSTQPGRLLLWQPFTAATVPALRHTLTARLAAAGLTGDAAFDFVVAVHELVTNAIRHGGGHGRLELSLQERTLICSISDHGSGANGLPAGPPPTDRPGGRGLHLARQLTGALLIDQRGEGVTATVTVELPATV